MTYGHIILPSGKYHSDYGVPFVSKYKTDDIYKNAWCLRKSPGILCDYHVIYVIGHGICAIGLGICVNSHPRSKPPPSL